MRRNRRISGDGPDSGTACVCRTWTFARRNHSLHRGSDSDADGVNGGYATQVKCAAFGEWL